MAFQQKRDYLPYAVGNRVYGGGRSFPHMGPVTDTLGYRERDMKHRARRQALLNRLRAQQGGNYMSSAVGRNI
jgi:hypothetical protein